MDVVSSAITMAGDVMNGFWSFSLENPVLLIMLIVSLVGVGVGFFFTLKSRLGGRKGRK